MRKKTTFVLTLMLSITFVTACIGEREEPINNTKSQMLLNRGSQFVYTFQDVKTGVWYISTNEGVTPRLNADGSLYVTD